MENYNTFLEAKIEIAESFGVDIYPNQLSEILKPHQSAIVPWCIAGGRRAIFASFGLGKTLMQLELAKLVMQITNKPFLICMPLGVVGEFKRDNKLLNTGYEIEYITDTDTINSYELKIYVTNYARVRMGDIDPDMVGGVSFDEGSAIRNLSSDTTNYILSYFKSIRFRFIATATPTPNDLIEILNYADFLGVIDRGHALTRFFKRDPVKAGNLTLNTNKREEFWKWVSTWAVFINKPSDLGFDDTGYDLPPLHFYETEVKNYSDAPILDKQGNYVILKEGVKKGAPNTFKEKGESIDIRVAKAVEIVKGNPGKRFVLWCHIDKEQRALEKAFKEYNYVSVFGSLSNKQKEDRLIDFSDGKYDILISKPEIAGSGCNFQHVCHNMIFVGINDKFNDFIQAIHRIFRFGQRFDCNVWAIFTQNEYDILKRTKAKWRAHIDLNTEMINLVRHYGLNTDKVREDMKRQMFNAPRRHIIGGAEVVNNDAVYEWSKRPSNSIGLNLSSWPFGDHYEYSDNYNDFGHNDGNRAFFKQCGFLTPNLYRTLMPGRVMAVHVKDRIRYGHQNGVRFPTIDDFSGDCIRHCKRNGFHYVGRITITTDVVRENNQTYRLTHGEQLKDGSVKGVGLPEYVLLFRKPPSGRQNGYADDPVVKKIDEYLLSLWQLDAHAYWKSSGNRFLSSQELKETDLKKIIRLWKEYDKTHIYDFKEHLRVTEDLDRIKVGKFSKLSKEFMTLPPTSGNDLVWTDINRMNTLNANQVNRKREKHICPLQLDIIERLIYRFTNKGDVVGDPFGGLFSTAYKALEMGRKAFSTELNPDYYDDGLFYLKSIEYKINVPTLFDLIEEVA
jgi:DNA methylase/Helicase conserved C-terminal domain